ncbi:MAG: hypothetical protein OXI54_07520 [Chloroflexota bacterium]|nr:hypothetical protein [Chloroflexota bacterium]MDE2683981.1 hypothetical protein [Chloroflexota bacterium]
MVKETRIVFDLGDIRHVRIICTKCQGEIARSLSQSRNMLPQRCPNCLEEWWDEASKPRVIDATVEMLKAVDRLVQSLSMDEQPVAVRFEIDGEDEK